MSSSALGPDGKVYCNHMEEAAKHRSNTPKHPNREFYCCKRPQRDPTRCKFWCWADELGPRETIAHASSSLDSSSKEEVSPSGRPLSTRYARSPQKHVSSPTSLSEMNLRNKKRLEDIEVGLKQRDDDLSPTRPGPSKEPRPCAPISIVPVNIPQPPSPVPTEVDSDEVEAQPPRTYSFLGLSYSPVSVASVIKDEDRPSTPKKRRMSPRSAPGGGLLLTPPQSTRRVTEFDQPEPPITCSRKGKEREGALVQPREDSFSSKEPPSEDTLPLFTLPEDASRVSSVSPTPAENVLDYTDGVKARVKALMEYMDSFNITEAVKLLQTAERQKAQYEYRDKSQKKRIEELVAEKDALAAEVLRLEDMLRLDKHL